MRTTRSVTERRIRAVVASSCLRARVAVESCRSRPGPSLGGTFLGRWLGSRVIVRLERQPRPSSAPEPPGRATGGRNMALKGKVLRSVTVLGALLLVVAGCSRDSGGDDAAGGEEDRQARRHRAAHRAALRARPRHQELGRPGHPPGQREGHRTRVRDRPRRRGRHGRPGHRGQRRQQAGLRPAGRRCGRHAELQRLPVGGAGAGQGEHRPGLAGQHQPDPDPRAQAGRRPAADLADLLPDGHHRRLPGPVRGRLRAAARAASRAPS